MKEYYKFFLLLVLCLFPYAHILGKEWNRVYLATYPRSGNHWTRYLIEEATGLATSSVYRDHVPPHLASVFPWGGYCADHGYEGNRQYPNRNQIVVIKTHFPVYKASFDGQSAKKNIVIMRHPIDCFYSYYLYLLGKNGTPAPTIPKKTINRMVQTWKEFVVYWSQQPNTYFFRYEDLMQSPHLTFTSIMNEIGYQVEMADINRALEKYPSKGHLFQYLEHYKKSDLEYIEKNLGDLMKRLGYTMP